MALTVPRLTPNRMEIFRCDRRPSRNIRRISSITVFWIIVQLSPKIARLGIGFNQVILQLKDFPRIVHGLLECFWHDKLHWVVQRFGERDWWTE